MESNEVNENNEGMSRGEKIRKEIFSWVRVLLFAAAAAFVINNVLIVNAAVPTGSMRDTIAVQSRLVAWRLSYIFSEPQRFDVVVFRFPDDESELHVKRIIGMPGDRVDIVGGQVFINESTEPLDEWYLLEPPRDQNLTFNVPEDSYFVMGDNRNNSTDSRGWNNTFLPRENILGRAAFTYFPSIGIIR
ncbi:MAG: signal peptidase I [Clostridiales bacterium]|nr:signal peptidase I [Clostridiales bacterium]